MRKAKVVLENIANFFLWVKAFVSINDELRFILIGTIVLMVPFVLWLIIRETRLFGLMDQQVAQIILMLGGN